ncbi:MAG: D-isomer specific 2-hydroxyacid dehydrogenase family protein [Oscillospiraceae bacterium]|jgi:D-lactate dehydrogenase|nr:D-isomer specific 2-hydroxyacid dehydrogenase family protein [Oscillospiraceae bacterium]MCI1990290.1 D-isomer specific 2-hydroxyacid dehydrogenase family protein [Oscillospiraceae bacterium]MCI2035811.1 D-isomer specific 2-hydroxyacid dehydrogenase family protein [Oscillospiraceae bacterium]
MKLIAYNYRSDELGYFKKFAAKYGVELTLKKESPSAENVDDARGRTCMSMITTPMTEELMRKFYDAGIRFVSTRSIGYDHIDVKAAKKIGMHIGNVSYTPNSVADYTVMLILMATRRMKAIARRSAAQDFSLSGVQGVELHNLTVGVIGTGRIGRLVAKRLSAFGCRLVAYDLYENEELKQYAEYVPLKRLFAESDLITMHMPATRDNYHLINRETLAGMKDGVFLINTARGSLIDTGAFLDAVESGKIGGAALDVVEKETGLYYNNLKCEVLRNRDLAVLKSYPNVIVTPHTAFYTDQAVSDMVEHSVESCLLFTQGKENPWQIV